MKKLAQKAIKQKQINKNGDGLNSFPTIIQVIELKKVHPLVVEEFDSTVLQN